ncbi:uncharacterized protein LOC125756543 [Rhipicephalus sanguineus]|uniref:uncharacterized protein LOC125756543 n=1 Tax=Rhipicephalus sanguineus TaxID=34632 RepID=UPI0020C48AB4|nr:uncharacterized protein LOC125756543 [Rhipicephalus sanguineus]
MKAYKSLEAHNYFTSGWVRNIAATQLQSERVVVLGEVSHSQRLREPDLKVWCLANVDGSIITAHCTCMAGAGEACSHIGAVLFAVETSVRLRETRTCTGRKNAWLPANRPGTQPKRLKEIDFSSSKKRKKQMDTVHLQPRAESTSTCSPQALPAVPLPPSDEEIKAFHSRLADAGVMPAIFRVHPNYSSMFAPPRVLEPQLLRNLLLAEAQSEDLDTLIHRGEAFLKQLVISEGMVNHVESITREQSSCPKWFTYRAGRITASVAKSVCSTSLDKPSVSLLKKICYPEQQKFTTAATSWGLEHECDAIKSYVAEMKQHHSDFQHFKPGVYLSVQHPYLAATPDASVSCTCCGKGIVEVKCPYTLASRSIEEASNDTSFCLKNENGKLTLRKTRQYYYQVQTQMAVCNATYCDFVVWTPSSVFIERVTKDNSFLDSVLASTKKFFTHVIMPELLASYFTRKTTTSSQNSENETVYCFCRGPESGKMLACEGQNCKYRWFHYICLGIRRAPKQKEWFCEECIAEKSQHKATNLNRAAVPFSCLSNVVKTTPGVASTATSVSTT